MAITKPGIIKRYGVANYLEKRSLLIAVNLVAGLSIFFFGERTMGPAQPWESADLAVQDMIKVSWRASTPPVNTRSV